MSDPEDDQPVHIQINNDSDSDSGDEHLSVRIQIQNDSSDDDEPNTSSGHKPSETAATALTTPEGSSAMENKPENDANNSSPLLGAGEPNGEPEPWDDSILEQVQSRDRINVSPEELKLMKLRAKHQEVEEVASQKPSIPVIATSTSPNAKLPDRRLTPSKQEEKRDLAVQNSLVTLPSLANSPQGQISVLNSPPPSATGAQSAPSSPKSKQNPFTIRTKLIARTLINIDLTNIKSIEDIEDALSYLHPDSTPYEGLVILPPIVADPEPQQQTQEATGNDDTKDQTEQDAEKSETTDPVSTSTNAVAPIAAAAVVVAATPVEDKKAREEEEKKRKEEEKKAAEEQAKAAKKAKEDEKKAAEEEAKRKKEEDKKRKEEEKKQAEEETKRKKEEEKNRKEDEKKAKEDEAKRKKEEEKRRKEEEKNAKKNKNAPIVAAAVVGTPSTPAEPSTNSLPDDDKENSVSNKGDNEHEPSVSRSGDIPSAVRLGGPNAPCAIPYHDPDFPQPITFEQATEILKSQKPYKISSKFQKANVFGTSGFKKPDHQICYFYQHLWDTDFDPTNRAHVLLLNAFYMHMNDLVVTPNHNADPLNQDLQRPAKCSVPELSGPHWANVRSTNTDEPWVDLQGIPARYTILRNLEQDLRPSILTLYLALYLLQGSPNPAFKKLVVALLRQFFLRDNAPSGMSYLELFAPLAYVINSLILSNTTVHAEPFYRLYYKCNLKKEFGQWIPFDEYNLNGFLLAVTEFMFVLPATFWFRHLIQQYDYPTLVCAVRQRLLSGMKAEFDRLDVEYCKGGYASYYNDVMNDNYLAQDLKVVFAEQKKQKHLLTPLEAQIHLNQQQRGPGRNSISYTAPAPTTAASGDESKPQTKIGPNIVVGKQTGAGAGPDSPTAADNRRVAPPPRTAAMNIMAQLQKQKQAAKKDGELVEDGSGEDDGEQGQADEQDGQDDHQQDQEEQRHGSDDDVEFKNDGSDGEENEKDAEAEAEADADAEQQ